MRAWLKGLEAIPEQAPSEKASLEHAHPDPGHIRAAYIVAADAVVVYTVGEKAAAVRVVFLGKNPPDT
jgi:hypothetical protein